MAGLFAGVISWLYEFVDYKTIIIASFVFVLLFELVRTRYKKSASRHLPPGPRGWPIIGNMASLDPKAPYRSLSKLSEEYGPIVSLQFGSFPVVILNDYASVRDAFVKYGENFEDRPRLVVFELNKLGKGFIRAYSGKPQKIRRRMGLQAMRNLGMGKFRLEEQVAEEVNNLIERFANTHGKPFCAFSDLEIVFCNVLCYLAFGKRFAYDDPKLHTMLRLLNQIFEAASFAGIANFIPILKYLPFGGISTIKRIGAGVEDFYRGIIKSVYADYVPDNPRNFIDMYFDSKSKVVEEDSDMEHWFDDEDIRSCVGDLFAAGTETSSSTMKWGCLFMCLHPDIQRRVQEELDREVGRDRMPRMTDKPNLPYTEATLMEIQRRGSITPLGVPRAPTVDTTLNGYDIPKGTVIIPNLWAVHHDPKVWKDPEDFKPERFLDDNGGLIRREELIPFSLGRRRCLGEQLALMELYIAFSHLLHRFTLHLPDGTEEPNLQGSMGAAYTPLTYQICAISRPF